jgi:hypothetical protein
MNRNELLDHVSERLGPANRIDPARVVYTVATNLTPALTREGTRSLAEALPPDLAPPLGGPHNEPLEAVDLVARTAQQLHVELSHAAEYVTVASQVIAEAVGPTAANRLRRDLPESLARLLEPAPVVPPAPPHVNHTARTVAEAQPAHPLYAAHPDTVQSGSVAAEPNPHAETKLSSAVGITQERTGRTIATGSPLKKDE